MDLLKVVREAVGFAEPQPTDLVREDELAIVPDIEFQLSTGLQPIMIGRWLGVCTDSLRRITETETEWYRTDVMGHLIEQGMSESEMLEAQAEFGSRLAPLMDRRFSPPTADSRNTLGRVPSRSSSRVRWNGPVCSTGCIAHRRCASSTSPDTPG
jgi:hypothetical protein